MISAPITWRGFTLFRTAARRLPAATLKYVRFSPSKSSRLMIRPIANPALAANAGLALKMNRAAACAMMIAARVHTTKNRYPVWVRLPVTNCHRRYPRAPQLRKYVPHPNARMIWLRGGAWASAIVSDSFGWAKYAPARPDGVAGAGV